ncbi:3-oxoacyl-[acyl-carrier-protein] synthase III C-terminal domain-containing protein [Parvibaculum sp.]|jgi:3-hydroxy-3-methylglutaryl CoA synthase|uniref:hydroxymethylglutaryl-CoA synthase family protein n=1 Tax=Parvibaculum sp. TaxID=2024848 RepID=UPI001B172E93|nr:3-oxoacyl-[acyl-carrier-protein] synthase III C-terminal domain-containing protein [Parvibaculum sp.]MBO6634581.1 hydroxymethylglutaryl-CoA synthase family protein [Parvibaculum sp.]MBO6679116.1 hydroxymethylglutaryl-CoA synthase family protein [Parvibaculum sp.]MBO6686516.1 hydroxymethylglutaryl-CoA synthase family protein [Parvibaculum sp.]
MAQQLVGLTAYGGYIPRLRLQRKSVVQANAWVAPNFLGKGKGERSMANWDEDAVTMAVEAARDLLGPDDDRSHVDALYFGSTTMPFRDRLNSGIVAAALTLDEKVRAVDVGSTQRAGTSALLQAVSAVKAGEARHALVLASDHRKTKAVTAQELDFGDGAAALSVGTDNVIANYLGGASLTVDFVDHFRGDTEEFDYNWEERWIRDEGFAKIVPRAVKAALEDSGVSADEVRHFVLPCSFGMKFVQQLAKRSGIDPETARDTLAGNCGETGAAHALVMLIHTLQTEAKPGDKVLVLQFGGGCDALVFEVTDKIASQAGKRGIVGSLKDRMEETNYMKFLTFNGLIEWEKGMRAEQDKKTALTTLYRNEDMLMGLVGGRCKETGVVQFPRSRISVNPNNHTVDTQEPYKFAEKKAKILSWSADFLSFSMNPPNHYGMVVFDEGGRIMMDFTDVEPGTVDSGMEVKLVFRIKEFDDKRGFRRYFWKAVPIASSAAKSQTGQAAE